jgi:imidazolonepropionase-like amidohydrolase
VFGNSLPLLRKGELGTIEEGNLADLVLLEANPLDDISNTRKIAAVVSNGHYFGKDDLERMLAGAAASARKR